MSASWTWVDGTWHSPAGTAPSLTATNLPEDAAHVIVRAPADELSRTVLDALVVATNEGIDEFYVGTTDADAVRVYLPPPPTAARDFAVIHAGPSGARVSAPGGAEHHVSCGSCGTASDWVMTGVADALQASGSDEVLVSVSPEVPWGAAMAAFEASGERTLRIARER